MFKKALHRITVLWCLYGLGRFFMFVHPHLQLLFAKIDSDCDPEIVGRLDAGAWMWFMIVIGGLALFLIGAAVHHFSNWFFNTDN